jgi:uncharacterized protein YaaQ
MNPDLPDRLAILNISGAQESTLFTHLAREKFSFTVINSTGGMIAEPMVCLLVGFNSGRISTLLDVVRKNCRSYRKFIPAAGYIQGEITSLPFMEAKLGGAQFFLMNVERFEQI